MNIGKLQDTRVDALSAGQSQVSTEALAISIRDEHARFCESFGNAIGHALAAGRLLIKAKSAIGHGGWLAWLTQNCELPERTAQCYMRLAKGSAMQLEGNPQRVADLSVRVATALLAKHKSPNINTDKSQDAVRSERESLDKKIEALRKELEHQRDCVSFLWTAESIDENIAALVGKFVESITRAGCRVCVSNGTLMFTRSKGCPDAPLEPPASVYTEVASPDINLD